MKTYAFIFARGGSKGLPNKNLRFLAGKPLIGWSIDIAKKVSCINRIIVSTDSHEIAEVAVSYGAEVPFIRPAELATDASSEWLSWRHALDYLTKQEGDLPDIMLSLPATAPLRSVDDVDRCINAYKNGNCDVVITYAEAHRNPFFNMVKKNSKGYLERVINPTNTISRRQDAPEVYDMTTVAYVTSPKFVMSNNSIFDGNINGVLIPAKRSIDIDTIFDLKFAEFLLSQSEA